VGQRGRGNRDEVWVPSVGLGVNQNENCWCTPRQFSYEWQAKDLRDMELGRVYGSREVGLNKPYGGQLLSDCPPPPVFCKCCI
jgi:hypothetical protein